MLRFSIALGLFGLGMAAQEIQLSRIASGLTNPTDIQSAGDGSGRLFFVEQPGRIRIYRGETLLSTPFLDIADRVLAGGERGLLGLAFPPDYASKGYFYVNYTNRPGGHTV